MKDNHSFNCGFLKKNLLGILQALIVDLKKVFEGYSELKSWILKKFLKDTQSLNRGLKKIWILWALIVDLKKYLKDTQSLNRGFQKSF